MIEAAMNLCPDVVAVHMKR